MTKCKQKLETTESGDQPLVPPITTTFPPVSNPEMYHRFNIFNTLEGTYESLGKDAIISKFPQVPH